MTLPSPIKKRDQHYVWRYYLKAWASNGLIHSLEDGKIRLRSLRKIAYVPEFYRLERLTAADLQFLERIVLSMAPRVQQLNLGWIETFRLPLELASLLEAHPRHNADDVAFVDTFLTNFEEDLHGRIENNSVKHLDALRRKDATFLNSDIDAADFLHYIAMQYFRTQKTESSVVESSPLGQKDQIKRIWKILRHILAANVAGTIFFDRKNWSIIFLENTTTLGFLTGDQPTINTFASDAITGEPVEELEFYYPVLPRLAIVLTRSANLNGSVKVLDPNDVHRYNRHIVKAAGRQIFSDKKEQLEAINNGRYT